MFIPDGKLPGLYKRRRVTGDKWVVKAKQRGLNKPVTITLGRVDVIKVTEARAIAREKLAALAAGRNPNQEAKQAREIDQQLGITLQEAIEEYLGLRELKESTIKSYRQVLARSFADWYSKPINEIARQDIVKRYKSIREGIAKRKLQPEKANPRGLADAQKSMRYLSAVLNSYSNDSYKGTRLLPDGNPVLVLKDKKMRKQLKPRVRFLERTERRDLFDELSHVGHPEYKAGLKPQQADFVLLLMITGLRFDEARTIKWENITSDTYTITDTKNGEEHTLPITWAVDEIFIRNRNSSEWVFSGRNGAASMYAVIDRASKAAGVSFTAHDLRRTAATVAAELGFSRDQIGRLLNHKNSNVTEGYIQRTSKMLKPILQAIEDEILAVYETPVEDAARDNVKEEYDLDSAL